VAKICLICGSSEIGFSFKLAATEVFTCRGCSFSFCDPVPKQESESAGKISVETSESYTHRLMNTYSYKNLMYENLAINRDRVYQKYLGKANYRVLEVGCASGGLGKGFEKLEAEYHGIDIDKRLIEYADMPNVKHLDVMDIPEEETYDVICFSQVLEHITDPHAFCQKIYDLLNPRGVVHCDVPNHGALSGRYRSVFMKSDWRYGSIAYPYHVFGYTNKALKTLLSKWFSVKVFSSNPPNKVWGQTRHEPWPLKHSVFYKISGLIDKGSMLVAVGQKQA